MKHAPESGYVSYEPNNETVIVRMESGKIDLSVYLSNETDSSIEIIKAITSWADDSASVIIAPHFSIASPVDYLIDMNQMPARQNRIDATSKPLFDLVKAEMLEQVKRIDALIFEDVSNPL